LELAVTVYWCYPNTGGIYTGGHLHNLSWSSFVSINPVEYSVLESIQNRWSPYRFAPQLVEPDKLVRCFEAARWAASSFNDQPWGWIVATRDDTEQFEQMIGCLMGPNQGWARNAGALVLTVVRDSFAYNKKPNRVALHDLGQASAHLALQATALGLQVHQMAGIDQAAIRQQYGIPDSHEAQTAIAIGYPETSEPSDEASIELRKRETGSRQRHALGDLVFSGQWDKVADFIPKANPS
jgi:nitroreductase